MNTEINMDGGNVEEPTGLDPSDGQPSDLEVATAPKTVRHRSLTGRIARGVLGLLAIGSPAADQAVNISQASAQEFSQQQPNISLELKASPHGSIAEDLAAVKSLQYSSPTESAPQVRIEATGAAEAFKAPLVVDREWVERNPQNIVAEVDLTDSNGDLIKQFTVLNNNVFYATPDNSVLYETHLEGNVFTERRQVSNVPIGNVQSLAVTADGRTLIAGGTVARGEWIGKVFLSSDQGQTWIEKSAKFNNLEGFTDQVRISGNTFMANNARFEAGSNQFLYDVVNGDIVNVRDITYQDQNGNPVAVGFVRDMRKMSVENDITTMITNGSNLLEYGLLVLRTNLSSGQGTVEHITQVMVNNTLTNLGYLYGNAFYTDQAGNQHVKTFNSTSQVVIDVNLRTLTATESYVAGVLNNKGIVGYSPDTLRINTLRIDTDAQGNIRTRAAGHYNNTTGVARAVAVTLETGDYVDLFPGSRSAIAEGGMQLKSVKGQLVEDFRILERGKAILLPDGQLLFTDGGFPGQITARAYLPLVTKTSSGW